MPGYVCPCGYVQECALLDGRCRHCHTERILQEQAERAHENNHRERAVAELTAAFPEQFSAFLAAVRCDETCEAVNRYLTGSDTPESA